MDSESPGDAFTGTDDVAASSESSIVPLFSPPVGVTPPESPKRSRSPSSLTSIEEGENEEEEADDKAGISGQPVSNEGYSSPADVLGQAPAAAPLADVPPSLDDGGGKPISEAEEASMPAIVELSEHPRATQGGGDTDSAALRASDAAAPSQSVAVDSSKDVASVVVFPNPLPLAAAEARSSIRRLSSSFETSAQRVSQGMRYHVRRVADGSLLCVNACGAALACCFDSIRRVLAPAFAALGSEAKTPFVITFCSLFLLAGGLLVMAAMAFLLTFRAVVLETATAQGAYYPLYVKTRDDWVSSKAEAFRETFGYRRAFPNACGSGGCRPASSPTVSTATSSSLGYSLQAYLTIPGVIGASWSTNDTTALAAGLSTTSPFIGGDEGGIRPSLGVPPYPPVAPSDPLLSTSSSFMIGAMNTSFSDGIPWQGRRVDGLFQLVFTSPSSSGSAAGGSSFNVSMALPLAFTHEYPMLCQPTASGSSCTCPYGVESGEGGTCLGFFRLRSICLNVAPLLSSASRSTAGQPFSLGGANALGSAAGIGCTPVPRIPYLQPRLAQLVPIPQVDGCFPMSLNGLSIGDYVSATSSAASSPTSFLSLGSSTPGNVFFPAGQPGSAAPVPTPDFSSVVSTAPWPYPAVPWYTANTSAFTSAAPPPGLLPVVLRSSDDPYPFAAAATASGGDGYSWAVSKSQESPLVSALLPLFPADSASDEGDGTATSVVFYAPSWSRIAGLWAGAFLVFFVLTILFWAVPTMRLCDENGVVRQCCLLYPKSRARRYAAAVAAAKADTIRLQHRHSERVEALQARGRSGLCCCCTCGPFEKSSCGEAEAACTYWACAALSSLVSCCGCCSYLASSGPSRRRRPLSTLCCYFYYRLACCASPMWLVTLPWLWCAWYWGAVVPVLTRCPCCRAVSARTRHSALVTMQEPHEYAGLWQESAFKGQGDVLTAALGASGSKGDDGDEEQASLLDEAAPQQAITLLAATKHQLLYEQQQARLDQRHGGDMACCGPASRLRSVSVCCWLSVAAWLASVIIGGFALSLGGTGEALSLSPSSLSSGGQASWGHWYADKALCDYSPAFLPDQQLDTVQSLTGFASRPSSSANKPPVKPGGFGTLRLFNPGAGFMAFGDAARLSQGTAAFLWSSSNAAVLSPATPGMPAVPSGSSSAPAAASSNPSPSPLLFPSEALLYSRLQISAFLLMFTGVPAFIAIVTVLLSVRFVLHCWCACRWTPPGRSRTKQAPQTDAATSSLGGQASLALAVSPQVRTRSFTSGSRPNCSSLRLACQRGWLYPPSDASNAGSGARGEDEAISDSGGDAAASCLLPFTFPLTSSFSSALTTDTASGTAVAYFVNAFVWVCLLSALAASCCYLAALYLLSSSSSSISAAVCTYTAVVVAASGMLPDQCGPTTALTVYLPLAAAFSSLHTLFVFLAAVISAVNSGCGCKAAGNGSGADASGSEGSKGQTASVPAAVQPNQLRLASMAAPGIAPKPPSGSGGGSVLMPLGGGPVGSSSVLQDVLSGFRQAGGASSSHQQLKGGKRGLLAKGQYDDHDEEDEGSSGDEPDTSEADRQAYASIRQAAAASTVGGPSPRSPLRMLPFGRARFGGGPPGALPTTGAAAAPHQKLVPIVSFHQRHQKQAAPPKQPASKEAPSLASPKRRPTLIAAVEEDEHDVGAQDGAGSGLAAAASMAEEAAALTSRMMQGLSLPSSSSTPPPSSPPPERQPASSSAVPQPASTLRPRQQLGNQQDGKAGPPASNYRSVGGGATRLVSSRLAPAAAATGAGAGGGVSAVPPSSSFLRTTTLSDIGNSATLAVAFTRR